jgi:hypothetical protein
MSIPSDLTISIVPASTREMYGCHCSASIASRSFARADRGFHLRLEQRPFAIDELFPRQYIDLIRLDGVNLLSPAHQLREL